MNTKELDEVLDALRKTQWDVELCDTPVPFYDNEVMCGMPASVGDVVKELIMEPHETLSMQAEFYIIAKGDSMVGVGIEDGDWLRVTTQATANDGDVVLALLDGDCTLKSYCEDEDGQAWLVPQNEKYEAFPMSDATEARILGVVCGVVKKAPRVKYGDCIKLIRKAKQGMERKEEYSHAQISRSIQTIAPMVKVARQWYAVCRVLEDLTVVGENDFDAFCQLVKAEVPEHLHLPSRDEMSRMAVQSFKRPVAIWTELNAPVQGKRFRDYLKIAQRMQNLLNATD